MRRFFWFLNKFFMVPIFQLGLGPFFGNPLTGYIMVLKVIGRRTGRLRFAPVNYAIFDGKIFCLSGYRKGSDWYRNLRARPAIQDEAQRLRRYLASLPLKADERPLLVKRLATLSGGVGELKIGAISKTELETRRARAERAFKVLSAAQRGGVVAGGGAALVHSLPALRDIGLPGDAGLGVQILARALPVPLRQLVGNARVDKPEWILQQIRQAGPPATFDVLNSRVVDARQTGILDATQVVKAVFQIAVSGAMMALKTDTIVYHRKPQESEGLEP